MPRPGVQGSDGEAPTRVERDPLGPIAVPQAALYGAQTERGRANFRVSGLTLADRPELIAALGQVKAASVRANQELGEVPGDLARVILQAAREVAANELDEHFPLDVVQGGGGTATNMNVNEVIANRAADCSAAPPGCTISSTRTIMSTAPSRPTTSTRRRCNWPSWSGHGRPSRACATWPRRSARRRKGGWSPADRPDVPA